MTIPTVFDKLEGIDHLKGHFSVLLPESNLKGEVYPDFDLSDEDIKLLKKAFYDAGYKIFTSNQREFQIL